jgi:hypothetical protein
MLAAANSLRRSSSQIRITTIIAIIIILRILARTMARTMPRIMLKIMTLMFAVSATRLSTTKRIVLDSRNGLRRRVMILSLLLMNHS